MNNAENCLWWDTWDFLFHRPLENVPFLLLSLWARTQLLYSILNQDQVTYRKFISQTSPSTLWSFFWLLLSIFLTVVLHTSFSKECLLIAGIHYKKSGQIWQKLGITCNRFERLHRKQHMINLQTSTDFLYQLQTENLNKSLVVDSNHESTMWNHLYSYSRTLSSDSTTQHKPRPCRRIRIL